MRRIKESGVTPEQVYLSRPRLSRRQFLRSTAALAAGAAWLAACGGKIASPTSTPLPIPTSTLLSTQSSSGQSDELGNPLTSYQDVTGYTNYYEFTTSKDAAAKLSQGLITSPWKVEVGGLVNHPKTYDLNDLLKFGQEERIYRLRCVETWAMVIPWLGFPLKKLLNEVEPTSDASYVRFESLYDPGQMPNQKTTIFHWPYIEGLRLDEAMHDLTLLAMGLYGKPLPPQNGAPLRLVIPWKYGFKSIKAIVKIDLVKDQPVSFWSSAAPKEYGFYANVNPKVDHPRWSQAAEHQIGESGTRPTLLFNGYDSQVSELYQGMDLSINF